MNILLDSKFKNISAFLDKRHNIVLFDATTVDNLSSEVDKVDIVAESIYVKYVDNNIDVLVLSKELLDAVIELDIHEERILGI